MISANIAAERAVLGGICRYGNQAYFDVCDIIRESTFTLDSNQILYKCISNILERDNNSTIDLPSILSSASSLGLSYVYDKPLEIQHLNTIMSFPADLRSIRKFAGIISKLEVGRLLQSQLLVAKESIDEITGEESLASILGLAENAIFDFSSLLNDSDTIKRLGSGAVELVNYLANNPVDQIGISTGYKHYDESIGGGLRNGTVNVIAGRSKSGKSLISANIAYHIAANEGIPVLYLDTEMLTEDQLMRGLAMISMVPINDIETGKFALDPIKKAKVEDAARQIENKNFFHQCIGGVSFEEQIALMRRWILKEVGFNSDGTAKKCVIVYDYIKLMTDDAIKGNIQEHQAIGFLMTGLHNFSVRYKLPIVASIQINRDGLTKEGVEVISQSDRVVWLCSNCSIFKKKSDEEVAQDGPENGNRKLVVLVARHGAGMEDGDYVNFHMKGWCAKITEGQLHSKLNERPNDDLNKGGFEIQNDDEDIPFE